MTPPKVQVCVVDVSQLADVKSQADAVPLQIMVFRLAEIERM